MLQFVEKAEVTGCERNRSREVLDPAVLTFEYRLPLILRKYRDCGRSFHRLSLRRSVSPHVNCNILAQTIS